MSHRTPSNFYTSVISFGNDVFVRKIVDGKRELEHIRNYHPRIWVPAPDPDQETGWKNLSGYSCSEFDAGNIKETRDFVERNKSMDNFSIYGNIKAEYQYVSKEYSDTIAWDISKINICYLDIEVARTEDGSFSSVEKADGEITAISIKFSNIKSQKSRAIFGCKEYTVADEITHYVQCSSEVELLRKFLEVWKSNYPDIVTGWNIDYFDIPYLVNRSIKLLGEKSIKAISPWGIIRAKNTFDASGREQHEYDIKGVALLDYIALYKKFTYTLQESYKLDDIAFVELGERKLDYSEFGSLDELYEKNFQKFIDYNKLDIELVERIENKMKLIELAITMAYDAKANFGDVFSQVRMWDVIIYNYLLSRGIVIPEQRFQDKKSIEGGYVKEPVAGLHRNIVTLDLQSLYPHLIMNYNISPETMAMGKIDVAVEDLVQNNRKYYDYLKENNLTMTANGQFFSREKKGFLPELMEWMFNQRLSAKKTMLAYSQELETKTKKNSISEEEKTELGNIISKYDNLQMAKKIALNSAYGVLANQYCRFYNLILAEGITLSGQLSIRWIARKLDEYLNGVLKTKGVTYVVYCDTDSAHVNLTTLVENSYPNHTREQTRDFLSSFCSGPFGKFINKAYDELADLMNAYDNRMVMKVECITDIAIYVSKKKYILNVLEKEGIKLSVPKMKIMGIEAIKSSTPLACRSKLKKALDIIITGDHPKLLEFIDEFREEFDTLPIHEVSFPRSVKGLDTYHSFESIYKGGTPIHVRGSLLYNHHLDKKGLGNKYSQIFNGDRIKFVYLKTPNTVRENIISFPNDTLPKELGLEDYVDRKIQFDKAFLQPLKSILDAINWATERKISLSKFFV